MVTFNARRQVTSEAFKATKDGLREWFGKPECIEALCSMADEFRMTAPDRVEIVTLIPFPGIVAKSVNVLGVSTDMDTLAMNLTMLSSTTVCETGPKWVRDFFVRILNSTTSTSDNNIKVRWSDEMAYIETDATLNVQMSIPGFFPLPIKRMEQEGSASLQNVLDDQMSPPLAKCRSAYLDWEAGRRTLLT
eukprot:CAMPEP_0182818638 /NCGR_PEP_ID=MMETSP0006_2-20121128/12131_1 /TAXON_ID=97485 /ORGANISM="Prymnesium parvum, Strain Texoma1" /LENGTH=190 /DNA_ID=CAMNT_0024945117 /DNA_START=107 /DNA_END=679 /DNA_ORIENTATION=+